MAFVPVPTTTPAPTPTPTPTPLPVKIQFVEGILPNTADVDEFIELENFHVVNVGELNILGGVSASIKWGDDDDDWTGIPIMADTGVIINAGHTYQSPGTFRIDLRVKSDSGDLVEYSKEIVVN